MTVAPGTLTTALQNPTPETRTGAGTIVVTLHLNLARRWRLVLENDAASVGSITAVSWRRSAVTTHYGPAESQTVAAPVAPGSSWGAADYDDCVDQLEVTITVGGNATVHVSLAGV